MSKIKKAQSKKIEEVKNDSGALVIVETDLLYYKKGDDLNMCLEETKNDPIEALRMHSDMLEMDSKILKDLADLISTEGEEVDINADCHLIWIVCSEKLADKIVKAELGHFPSEDEEDM